MVLVPELMLKKPIFDGRQNHIAHHQPLLRQDGRFHLARDLGQFSNGLVFKNLLGSQVQPCDFCAAGDLDTENGISTQLKEIIVNADFFEIKHRTPDLCQRLLPLVTGHDPLGRAVVLDLGFG